jgi:hypothetical protein
VIIHAFDEDFMHQVGPPNCPIHLLPLELDDRLEWVCPETHVVLIAASRVDAPDSGVGVSEGRDLLS